MYTETVGIVLRQTKTVGGRRMIVIFTEKYGKISAGTSMNERGKSKSSLLIRPFTYGRYELYKNRDSYNLSSGETLETFYSLGEDVDKYMAASVALELTDRLLEEEQPSAAMFRLLLDFLQTLEKRRSDYETLLLGFQVRALTLFGSAVQADHCIRCGKEGHYVAFSVPEGGAVCTGCMQPGDQLDPLIFAVTDDIMKATHFMASHNVSSLAGLSLGGDKTPVLKRILRAYYSYHLAIDHLKSEDLRV